VILYFGNDVDVGAVFFQQLSNFQHVARFANERSGNKIDALLNAEAYVIGVLFRNAGQIHTHARDVHPFSALQDAAVYDFTRDVRAVNLPHFQSDEAVVNQHRRADRHVSGQIFI